MNSLNRIIGLSIFSILLLFVQLISVSTAYGFYSCGQSPCQGAPWDCDSGLTCSASQVCGTYVNTCSGAVCQQDATWSQGAPYNCTDACTPGNTTRTFSLGTCTATCGIGNAQCVCQNQNNCPVTCSGGLTCGQWGTNNCCVSQIPQNTPSAVTCSQVGITRTAQVNWTFPSGTGCGQPFGYTCGGNNDRFELRFSGGKSTETAGSALRTWTTGEFPNWGVYTVQVCALNGFGETCSPTATCTLTAPTCTTTNMDVVNANPDNTCIATDPNLTASYSNNSNQINFLVDVTTPLTSPYTADSGWVGPPNPYTYTPSLSTGQYYWTVRSQSTDPVPDCVTPAVVPTGMEINIDKTAPAVPVAVTPTWTPNPTCLGEYMLTYNWNPSTDTGCAGLHAQPYQAQIATDVGFTTGVHTSAWQSGRSYTTTPDYYPHGTQLYAHVKARDSVLNESAYSAVNTYMVPSPTLYPTIHIAGVYEEDLNGTDECVGGMTIDPNDLTINLSFNPPNAAISYTCTPYATRYECDIAINNQADPCLDPNLAFNISNTTYGGYEAVEYRTNNDCGGTPGEIPINPQLTPFPTPTDIRTFFDYGDQTWFKASDTGFDNLAQRKNVIPNNIVAFDSDDTDDRYLIVKEAGPVLSGSGASINLGGNAEVSAHDWYSNNYSVSTIFTPAKFRDYVKSRKQYKTIEMLSEITASGIYYLKNDITMTSNDAAVFNGKNIVLVADGSKVTIDEAATPTHGFIPTGSLAIIADEIAITGTITKVNAILIGNTVQIGTSATDPLKVTGNLIQLKNSPKFVNTRTLNTRVTPSLFIKFDKTAYLNLLPYLSISVYDWRQVK